MEAFRTPRRATALFLWLILSAGCGDGGEQPEAAAGRLVRAFAVGNKLELRDAESYGAFRDKFFALADADHLRRSELVQAGVDDVASHLRPLDPQAPPDALVVFPEDVGLIAALIGSRGIGARAVTLAEGGSQAAFISLIVAYQPQIRFYAARHPGLPPIRYLLLATSDTVYRAAFETFRDLARTYGVHVAATLNLPPARIVTTAEDAALVDLLRDPDERATRDYAYLAASSEVFNSTYVFDPEGNVLVPGANETVLRAPAETGGLLRGTFQKVYLTETEQDVLPLSFGRLSELDVIDTAVGRLTSVISKDAWMIDVNDRLDAKRAEILLQPEAFSEWAFSASPWQPDGFKAGGFAQLQRNPSFLFNVTASLTGNLFEVTFDGQSAIIGKRRKDGLARPCPSFIGQNPDCGFIAVGPWVARDPGLQDPSLTLAERRDQMAAVGMQLLPGAQPACPGPTVSAACENGYRESVVFADLELPAPAASGREPRFEPVPTAFGASVAVSPGGAQAQRRARIAARGESVYVVWEDDRFGFSNVLLAYSTDGGLSFEERRVSGNAPGSVSELRPAIAVDPRRGTVFVVWQELCTGTDDDCGRIRLARFDAGGKKLGDDVAVDDDLSGRGKWSPAIALRANGDPTVVWIDERDMSPGGAPLAHVHGSDGTGGGTAFGANRRVDAGSPVAPAVHLDHKWSPAITASSDRVAVAWTDFRNYNWDIFLALLGDEAAADVRVDDAPGYERIHDHPSLAIDDAGEIHVVWADRRDTDAETDIYYARGGAAGFSAHRKIDGSEDPPFDPDRDAPSHQWFPRIAADGDELFVVWQDDRLGDNDLFFRSSHDRGETFVAPERVDDSGDNPSGQYRPDLAIGRFQGERAVYVVWEEDRVGPAEIRLVRALR